MLQQNNRLSFVRATARGFAGRCPNCGKGKLFRAFLKPIEQCACCSEAFGHIRADDGPAWLTILIVGHMVVPLLLVVERHTDWPRWAASSFWSTLVVVLVLVFLPRSKGAFIGAIWQTRGTGADDA